MVKESEIQRKILEFLYQQDRVYVRKIITANRAGTPDIVGCRNGKFFAVEVKKQGGKVSQLQWHNGDCINFAGGKFCVVFDFETFLQWWNDENKW